MESEDGRAAAGGSGLDGGVEQVDEALGSFAGCVLLVVLVVDTDACCIINSSKRRCFRFFLDDLPMVRDAGNGQRPVVDRVHAVIGGDRPVGSIIKVRDWVHFRAELRHSTHSSHHPSHLSPP